MANEIKELLEKKLEASLKYLSQVKKELKISEKKFKSLFEQANDSIFIVDAKTQKFLKVNENAAKNLGYTKKELLKLNLNDIYEPIILSENNKIIKNLKEKGHILIEREQVRKDKTTFPVEISSRMIDFGDKQVFQSIVRDITKRKKYEQALKNQNKLIEEEVKRKTKEIQKLNEQLSNYAKKLDLKIRRIDDERVPLTNKEKKAFYGLVKYPNATSKEIAEKLDMKIATVNSIKNRLKKEKYFKTMYIPRFDMLGYDLLDLTHNKNLINTTTNKYEQISKENWIFENSEKIPEQIFLTASNKDSFSLNFTPTLAKSKEIKDELEMELQKKEKKFEKQKIIYFPLESSTLQIYFNFANLINQKFKLNMPPEQTIEVPHKKYKLSATEKKILYALIKYPEFTVAQLAKRITISVPTICKAKRKLLETGILKVVNFPNFKKIGMELLIISQLKKTPTHQEINKPEHCCKNQNVFFSINNKTDHISLGVYSDYTEAEKSKQLACANCLQNKFDQTVHTILTLKTENFNKLNFLDLTKKILNLETDY